MAEIVNLRRARKNRSRAEKSAQSDATRIKHGVAKPVRQLAKARREKEERDVGGHKLDKEK